MDRQEPDFLQRRTPTTECSSWRAPRKLRVTVTGTPAPAQLTTPQALACVGPAAFGYDLPFTPLQRA